MRIGIDISQIVYSTGVSIYTENLVKSLLEVDVKNEYLLFGGSFRRREGLISFAKSLDYKYGSRVKSRIFHLPPTFLDWLWNKWHILPVETFTGRLNVFHSSDWVQPPSYGFRVTTIHDLSPLRFPKLTHPKIVEVTKNRLKWIKKEVDRIIVPSQATYEDLLLLKFDRRKIKVIPEAVDPFYKKISSKEKDSVRKKYRADNFILAVGTNKRKNLDRIISAFDLVKAGKDLKLIVVGEKIPEFQGKRGVIFAGQVTKNELRRLYNSASALVYPSLYEGFGLPILEAFACGCPVVTSNVSSLPEVAGKAAILVNPYDESDIADGIKTALLRHKTLVREGEKRLKMFSWHEAARKTLEVYEEALA